MADDPVKWWNYPPGDLDYAERMHGERYTWDAIVFHMYRRGGCPYYHPEWLGQAVLARKRGEVRPRETSQRLPPPLPSRKVPAMPKEEPGPPHDVEADFAKEFPDKPFPGEAEATAALVRLQRRRRT
jgi:hypothetical protein